MANVYVNTLGVPRKARNKRIYAGNSFISNRTEITTTVAPPAEFKYPYGGIVTWQTGLTFDVSRAGRPINGYFYETAAAEVTLSAAHATLDRIDVFYIDINSVVGVLEGTPSATPQKPSIDPATQYELSFVEIPAAATEPAGIDEDVIYNENVEWTGSQSGTTVDFDSTTDPKVGSKCAEITNISNGDTINFTSASPLNIADYTTVGGWLKLKETGFLGNFIEVYFKNNGDPVGKLIVAEIDRQSLNWQFVSFNTADFEIPNGIFDGFTLRWHNNGDTYTGFYLDYIKLQKGIELPGFGDTYTTSLSFNNTTRDLTLEQNNKLPLVVNIPGSAGLTDAPSDGTTYGRKNGAWEAVTGGSGTDEKVKFDAGDTAAGYLSEKLVAGANIALTEGTGADENKQKIAVTGLATVATSGNYSDLSGTPTIPGNTYIGLSDTDDTNYTGKENYVPMVNGDEDGLILTETEVATFLLLDDTPAAYTGHGGKLLKVKDDETGVEFVEMNTAALEAAIGVQIFL